MGAALVSRVELLRRVNAPGPNSPFVTTSDERLATCRANLLVLYGLSMISYQEALGTDMGPEERAAAGIPDGFDLGNPSGFLNGFN